MAVLPVVAVISAAVRSPASVLRRAIVTSAPAPASARAVSIPMPDEPPVTIARLPDRSMPSITSAAVESNPNAVWKKVGVVVSVIHRVSDPAWGCTRGLVILVVTGPGSTRRRGYRCVMAHENLIGEYLRARRELVDPEDVCIPNLSSRRRVPRLRREEVAMPGGVICDYYVPLDQGRTHPPPHQPLHPLPRPPHPHPH